VQPWDWTRVAYAAGGANYHTCVSLRLARASLRYVLTRRHLRNSPTFTFNILTIWSLLNVSRYNTEWTIRQGLLFCTSIRDPDSSWSGWLLRALVLLDLSSAFNIIDHEVLHKRVDTSVGVAACVIIEFSHICVGRTQHVRLVLARSSIVCPFMCSSARISPQPHRVCAVHSRPGAPDCATWSMRSPDCQ